MNRIDALVKGLSEEDAKITTEEIVKGLYHCDEFKKFITEHYSITIFNPHNRAVKVYKLIRDSDGIVLNTWEITDFSDRSIEEELERMTQNFISVVWDKTWKRGDAGQIK